MFLGTSWYTVCRAVASSQSSEITETAEGESRHIDSQVFLLSHIGRPRLLFNFSDFIFTPHFSSDETRGS